MPRLIDADTVATFQTYDDKYEEWSEETLTIADALDKWADEGCPPTIEAEPVRHSENVTPYSGCENILCKECGFEGEVCEHEYDEYGNYVNAHGFECKYCPSCGAKMNGGADNADK